MYACDLEQVDFNHNLHALPRLEFSQSGHRSEEAGTTAPRYAAGVLGCVSSRPEAGGRAAIGPGCVFIMARCCF